ncbi:sensor histidine kinase [Actinophytocola sp.]|uniref:sensor histidine kinase n=1 Tax=Actinophytocola sp. TaxID=1872138 RepID=UPI002ED04056
MTPIPVPHRWLAALLGVALLLDTSMVLTGSPTRTLLVLPGAALLAVFTWFGVNRPAAGATFGAITLVVSSVLIRFANVEAPSIGLSHIMLTELISGVVLVVMVVWRCSPTVAFSCVPALVVACLASMVIRQANCDWYSGDCTTSPNGYVEIISPRDILQSMVFGFVLLAGAIGTGYYLRRSSRLRVETELGTLVRKQWPLGAALAVMALLELTDVDQYDLPTYIASVGVGVCAFFGPRYPLRNTLVAAAALMFSAVASLLYGPSSSSILPFTAMAASMALIAYVVRYVELRQAAWSTAALAVAMLLAMSVRTNSNSFSAEDLLFLLAFVLLVSIATGWYFRSRDRERNQTVAAAVTSAQQGERMALARELHDVVAHHVTGIVVQAQAALMVAEKNPGVALPALEKIERSGTEALTAMRTLVGSLREGTAAWTAGSADATGDATTDLVADLGAVVENFVGPPVEVDLNLPSQLPHEMGRSVLRLVQESLTNVGKHAPDASEVHLRVATIDDTLHIRVSDDGTKRPVNPAGGSGGYGLVGMRERVELLGGRFEAGPSGYVGWNVEAWLPLRKEGS